MKNALHICIVDDDDIYRFTLIKSIRPLLLGNKISVFTNGESALGYICHNQKDAMSLPDIILLDIDMPVMDGFQFLEEYEKIEQDLAKKITIHMVSSSVDPRDIKKAKSYSAVTDYIIKPLKKAKLKSLIEK